MTSPAATARPAWWWHGVALALTANGALLWHLHRRVAARALGSYDGPWHLTTGRIIAEQGGVPRTDPILFTTTGIDWVNPDWLAQLFAFRSFQALGFSGPLALSGLLFLLTLLFVWANLRARQTGPVSALIILALVLDVTVAAISIRPRGYSYALLALLAWLLARPPDDAGEVPLTGQRAAGIAALLLIWNQLHGGFVYGYALVVLDALGTCVDSIRRGGARLPRRARRLLAAAGVGLLGFALHPHGFDVPLRVVGWAGGGLAEVARLTIEMRPLDFARNPQARLVELGVLLALFLAAASPRPVRFRELLPALFFLHWTLQINRIYIPLLVVAGPYLASELSEWLTRRGPRLAAALAAVERRLTHTLAGAPVALGGGALVWLLLFLPARSSPGLPGQVAHPALDAARLPVGAARYLVDAGGEGRVFNRMADGGLLGWALYPQRRIAIDGRTGFHSRGGGIWSRYRGVVGLSPGWREQLDRWEVEWVVERKDAPLLHALEQAGWKRVYEDARYAVVRRGERANR